MYNTDFEYNGLKLSHLGFIICNFDYSNGVEVADVGMDISFNKVSRNNGERNVLVSTKLESCLTTTFDICKDPDIYTNYEDREITSEEYRYIGNWLQNKEFHKLKFIDENQNELADMFKNSPLKGKQLSTLAGDSKILSGWTRTRNVIDDKTAFQPDEKLPYWYNATFTMSKIKISDKVYGIRLVVETDSSYCYGEEQVTVINFGGTTGENKSTWISALSDEVGVCYPKITIQCKGNGTIFLMNRSDYSQTMVIKGCIQGEIIDIDCENKIIHSSLSSHDLSKDFNFVFWGIRKMPKVIISTTMYQSNDGILDFDEPMLRNFNLFGNGMIAVYPSNSIGDKDKQILCDCQNNGHQVKASSDVEKGKLKQGELYTLICDAMYGKRNNITWENSIPCTITIRYIPLLKEQI